MRANLFWKPLLRHHQRRRCHHEYFLMWKTCVRIIRMFVLREKNCFSLPKKKRKFLSENLYETQPKTYTQLVRSENSRHSVLHSAFLSQFDFESRIRTFDLCEKEKFHSNFPSIRRWMTSSGMKRHEKVIIRWEK